MDLTSRMNQLRFREKQTNTGIKNGCSRTPEKDTTGNREKTEQDAKPRCFTWGEKHLVTFRIILTDPINDNRVNSTQKNKKEKGNNKAPYDKRGEREEREIALRGIHNGSLISKGEGGG
ncbi:hypothetical protein NDU88_002196 [Pleurodeles waltl]|uniref:Uncharacterized protein n=1 Tax=Pleurodeles waltl TaxID=8319 RepID=A0AAV7P602_PLEWA|nr:hypothetical protein NDU88_002196 [Pleurodeles waltl]